MKAIRVHEYGSLESLVYEKCRLPKPGPNEVLVRVQSIGVNCIDLQYRQGPTPPFPFIIGKEGAGFVAEVGSNINNIFVGARVAFVESSGSYAEFTLVSAYQVIPVPAKISFEFAAASVMHGLTAHYLSSSAVAITPGMRVMIVGGGGGVGRLLIQMAKMRGAIVYAVVSCEMKVKVARESGANHSIDSSEVDFVNEIKLLTRGLGVNVVYDAVGADTWEKSLACVGQKGRLVAFGDVSGPVPEINPMRLWNAGGITLMRPKLADYISPHAVLLERVNDLFSWMMEEKIIVRICASLPLEKAYKAHSIMESSSPTGKVTLKIPNFFTRMVATD